MRNITIGLLVLLLVVGCSSEPSKRPENAVVRGINYVGMSVSDLDQAAAFYGAGADLKKVEDTVLTDIPVLDKLAGRTGVRASTRMIRSSNGQLRLMQFENQSAAASAVPKVEVYGPGFAHACFQAAKKTKAYDNFLAAGAKPIGAHEMIQLNPRNPVEYAYARDADDTMFEVEHVDIAALNLDTPPRNNYRMRHIAIATPDMDRAIEFYSILLEQEKPRHIGGLFISLSGEKFEKMSGLPDVELEMAFFDVRNMELEIAQILSHPTERLTKPRPIDALGYNMIVFDVVDLGAAREKLIEAGGTVVSEEQAMDGGKILFGRDLDGNLLGFQVVASDAVFSSQNFENNGT